MSPTDEQQESQKRRVAKYWEEKREAIKMTNMRIGECAQCGGGLTSGHKCPDKVLMELAERLDSMPLNGETMKQIKEFKANHQAEAIAKFLGGELCGPSHNSTHKFGNHKEKVWDFDDSGGQCLESGLIDWLASDPGTVAMEQTLLDRGFSVFKEQVDAGIEIEIERDPVKGKGPCRVIQLTAEDVNKGLQAAILEVIDDG